MSGVIKSSDASGVRPLPLVAGRASDPTPSSRTPRVDPALVALREEVQILANEAARKDAEIARLTEEVARARAAGEAEGRRLGRLEAEDRSADALRTLEGGLSRAVGEFGASLGSLERLAVVLARESLGRLVGDAGARADLLQAMIRHQVAELDDRSIVRIEVSTEDFRDEAALQALASALKPREIEIAASRSLAAGGCRVQLVLGGLEIGLDQQWSRLATLLDALALPGGAA